MLQPLVALAYAVLASPGASAPLSEQPPESRVPASLRLIRLRALNRFCSMAAIGRIFGSLRLTKRIVNTNATRWNHGKQDRKLRTSLAVLRAPRKPRGANARMRALRQPWCYPHLAEAAARVGPGDERSAQRLTAAPLTRHLLQPHLSLVRFGALERWFVVAPPPLYLGGVLAVVAVKRA